MISPVEFAMSLAVDRVLTALELYLDPGDDLICWVTHPSNWTGGDWYVLQDVYVSDLDLMIKKGSGVFIHAAGGGIVRIDLIGKNLYDS